MFRLVCTVLLLLGIAAHPLLAAAAGCSIPDSYTHRTTTIWKSFLVTLATDRPAYAIGDSVHFWLSFENVGTMPDTIPNPSSISPMDVIVVFPAGCDSLFQDGCRWLFLFPHIVSQFGLPVILGPGGCAHYEHAWDGIDEYNQPIVPGTYTVIGGMISGGGHFHAPPGGIKLNIQIGSPVPTREITWGAIKAKYSD
jgi:hypothetical protein